jgi:translation initiation factor IF-2
MIHSQRLGRKKSSALDKLHSNGMKFNGEKEKKKLEIVLKCDVAGTAEAVSDSLEAIKATDAEVKIIQAGIGYISKSDILMAQTGSRLLVGFNVDVIPKLQAEIMEYGVEIRLYDTIYRITEDIKKIADNLIPKEPEERITGKAKVIATFKSSQKGIILGCEVQEGTLELGKEFRVITVMGPAYFGKIGSLKIEKNAVKIAKPGQQVGLSVPGWKKGKVGDWVECYETAHPSDSKPWVPRGGVFRYKSG